MCDRIISPKSRNRNITKHIAQNIIIGVFVPSGEIKEICVYKMRKDTDNLF